MATVLRPDWTVKQVLPNVSRRSIELDFVRGIAIMLVMASHGDFYATPLWGPAQISSILKQIGWSGVELFFVLSGFLVGGLLIREYVATGQVNARRFLLRRGFKIWPAYYAFLLVQIVGRKHPLSTFAVANLLHLQNYLGTSISHTWTLSLEEHFYIILALCLMWMARRRASTRTLLRGIAVVCVSVFAVRTITVLTGNINGAMAYTHCRLDGLLVGVALAILQELRPQLFDLLSARKSLLAVISSFGFIILFTLEKSSQNMVTWGLEIVYAGCAAFLLLVYRHLGQFRHILLVRGVAYIGLYSYGIYLWHNAMRAPIRLVVERLPYVLQFPFGTILQAVCMVAAGVVATRLIEWPMLRVRERVVGVSVPVSAPVVRFPTLAVPLAETNI